MNTFNPHLNQSSIISTKLLNDSIMEVTFTKPNGFLYRMGQFVSIKVNEVNYRAYSLVSHPSDDFLKIAAAVGHKGLGADYLKNISKLNNTQIQYIGPSGRFFLADSPSPQIIFLATGTGIAPFIPMLRDLIEFKNGKNSKIKLFLSSTTNSKLFYVNELERLKNLQDTFEYKIFLTRENIQGFEFGRITGNYSIIDPTNTQVYICGHPDMVNENINLVQNMGILDKNLFFEKFTSAVAH
jgi:ferredoxin-NADP reductase